MKGSENFNWRPVKPRLQANRSLLTWSSDLLTHGLVTFGFDTRCQSPHLGNLHHFLDCLGLGRPSMIFATHMNINIYIFKHNHFCLLCHSGRSLVRFYFTVQWEFFLFLFYFICFVVVVSVFTFRSLKRHHSTFFSGIICGPPWVSFAVLGSLAVQFGDHLRWGIILWSRGHLWHRTILHFHVCFCLPMSFHSKHATPSCFLHRWHANYSIHCNPQIHFFCSALLCLATYWWHIFTVKLKFVFDHV